MCLPAKKLRDRDAELHEEEETLTRYKHILTELPEKIQKPISKFYSEVVSGDTIQNRPVMQKLLADVEGAERLARGNTFNQGA